ncbi:MULTISPECIES: hypothetical protein [Enterococcus]|uniref:hypothetical protein n=1 Tax=Enterococcus TaxID=1350 RepID=UPI00065DEF77|nr:MULTISPECIES: hypothetical protein [Enterococcus]KAF1301179.1 hypothetical protein BAU16_10600 [Enterococcus sp. JM9B]
MKGIRNIALIILGLLMGFVANNFGIEMTLLVFAPLFLLWFTFWDDKKFRQSERQRHYHYSTHNNSEFYHYE